MLNEPQAVLDFIRGLAKLFVFVIVPYTIIILLLQKLAIIPDEILLPSGLVGVFVITLVGNIYLRKKISKEQEAKKG